VKRGRKEAFAKGGEKEFSSKLFKRGSASHYAIKKEKGGGRKIWKGKGPGKGNHVWVRDANTTERGDG